MGTGACGSPAKERPAVWDRFTTDTPHDSVSSALGGLSPSTSLAAAVRTIQSQASVSPPPVFRTPHVVVPHTNRPWIIARSGTEGCSLTHGRRPRELLTMMSRPLLGYWIGHRGMD